MYSLETYQLLLEDEYPFDVEDILSRIINDKNYDELRNINQVHYKRYMDYWDIVYKMDCADDINVFLDSDLIKSVFDLPNTFKVMHDETALKWITDFIEAWSSVTLKQSKTQQQPKGDKKMYEIQYKTHIHDTLDEFPIDVMANHFWSHPEDFKNLFVDNHTTT